MAVQRTLEGLAARTDTGRALDHIPDLGLCFLSSPDASATETTGGHFLGYVGNSTRRIGQGNRILSGC